MQRFPGKLRASAWLGQRARAQDERSAWLSPIGSRKGSAVILAIGAHPDDAEMGVGGILLAHRAKGHGVAVLTLSSGSAAGANVTITACEVEREARRIGAQSMLADLPDNHITADRLTIEVNRA